MNVAVREARRNAATVRIGRLDDGACYLCGQALVGRVVSRDHVQPRARQQRPPQPETRLTHAECNAAKGSLTLEQFVTLCRQVVQQHG
jgi:hypothetical protein